MGFDKAPLPNSNGAIVVIRAHGGGVIEPD
jgi:hypothetical protein